MHKRGDNMTPEIKQRIEQIRRGEVPEGYKNTKVGIVPEEWEETRFRNMFSRVTRKNKEGNDNVLTISAQYGLISQRDFFNKDIASEDKSNYYLLKNGEFAYNKSYSNGYPFGALKRLDMYDKGIVSPLYICFTVTEDNKCPDFYVHYFEAGKMNREIQAFAQEGARNHGLLNISVDDFFNSYIVAPSFAEQEKIAEILSAQDKLIELKEKLLEEKRRQKKYLIQQLFTGRKRLDGYNGEWNKHKLGEFIVEHNEKTTRNNQYPVLTSSRQGLFFQTDYYNKEIASEDNTGYNVVPRGCFTYRHMSDDEIFKFNINHIVDKGIVSTLYPVFKTKNINDSYLQILLNEGSEFKRFAMLQKQGGSRTYMYLDKLKKLSVLIPPIEEQNAITNIMLTIEKEIELSQKRLNQEKQKKKALMQLLLTGIVRV